MEDPEDIIECQNFHMCRQKLPIWWHGCIGRWVCSNCEINYGKDPLKIVRNEEDCSVCLDSKNPKITLVPCGHALCTVCYRNMSFFDDSSLRMSPVPFGGPPCPKGCVNPPVGKQCYCEEHDSLIENWENENRWQSDIWNLMQNASIDAAEYEFDCQEWRKKCPTCRAHITKLLSS